MTLTGDSILKENPVKRTPVTRPIPGMRYEHLRHGYVKVTNVDEGMVVFTRPGSSGKGGYINTRQQPVEQFVAQTVDVN